MSKPPPPHSLDALLARAEDFALFSMRSGGNVFIRVDPFTIPEHAVSLRAF